MTNFHTNKTYIKLWQLLKTITALHQQIKLNISQIYHIHFKQTYDCINKKSEF